MNSPLSQVAQVNIRLSEGGAAGVARALADGLRDKGVSAPFVYGYGRRGRRSPLHDDYDSTKLTPAAVALLNREWHRFSGQETRVHDTTAWRRAREVFEASDVVHLHAIHSYMANPYGLLGLLGEVGRPVVWTLHDQWMMTGRCAQPGDCRGWETGCSVCPDLSAYPPARIDHAADTWRLRRDAIRRLAERVPLVIVACAGWLAEEATAAGFQGVRVIRNSVDAAFWRAVENRGERRSREGSVTRNLFMCRDLRDSKKVDWTLLREAAGQPDQELTVVGNNPPGDLPGARIVPAVTNRTELAGIMREHDRLLFTSRVDYFPLTIAEALTTGLQVLALDSKAAREFSAENSVVIVRSGPDLIEAMRSPRHVTVETESFHPRRMLEAYTAIYEELA